MESEKVQISSVKNLAVFAREVEEYTGAEIILVDTASKASSFGSGIDSVNFLILSTVEDFC